MEESGERRTRERGKEREGESRARVVEACTVQRLTVNWNVDDVYAPMPHETLVASWNDAGNDRFAFYPTPASNAQFCLWVHCAWSTSRASFALFLMHD